MTMTAPLLSFTVTRKGMPHTFSTQHTLESAAAALAGSRSSFASDLIRAHERGHLTRNQAPWMLLLAEEAAPTIAQDAAPARASAEFLPLLEAVWRMQNAANESARERGRNPGKITLRFPGAQVSAVLTGQNTGSLYVKADGAYMGKIDQQGSFHRAYGIDAEEALAALRNAQADPTGAAIRYGRETGSCSCCGRELTRAESIQLGIGPICLERLGGAI